MGNTKLGPSRLHAKEPNGFRDSAGSPLRPHNPRNRAREEQNEAIFLQNSTPNPFQTSGANDRHPPGGCGSFKTPPPRWFAVAPRELSSFKTPHSCRHRAEACSAILVDRYQFVRRHAAHLRRCGRGLVQPAGNGDPIWTCQACPAVRPRSRGGSEATDIRSGAVPAGRRPNDRDRAVGQRHATAGGGRSRRRDEGYRHLRASRW